MPQATATTRIGPDDHGKDMPLERFARAEGAPGHVYELGRGVIEVVNVPGVPHARVVAFLRTALGAYQLENPGVVQLVSGGMDSVLRMFELDSERHPDVTVYLSAPPGQAGWDEWTPDIVVEVVSKESRDRDYKVKPREYLAAGVREYWIIDPSRKSATIRRRRGDTWRETRIERTAAVTTRLLPGFRLRLAEVFAAGGQPT